MVSRLAAVDPATLTSADQLAAIDAAHRHIDEVTAAVLPYVASAEATRAAAAVGCATTRQFLTQFCGKGSGRAAEEITTAVALRDRLPDTAHALQANQLSYEHAAVIARTTADLAAHQLPPAEQILVPAAQSMGPDDLRRLGETLRYQADPEAADKRYAAQHARRKLSISRLLDGSWRLDGDLDPSAGETVKTAIEAHAKPDGSRDERTPKQRRADALTALCEAALDAGKLPARHHVRPHVYLTVPAATLRGEPGAPPALTQYGGLLTGEAARGITCDADLSRIGLDGNGTPLDVGHAVRIITPAIRRALEVRDQGCRWPGCDQPLTWCTGHHLIHWAHGGKTARDNLLLLCWAHHHGFIHARGWTITGHPDAELTFTSPNGQTVLTSPPPGQPPGKPKPRRKPPAA